MRGGVKARFLGCPFAGPPRKRPAGASAIIYGGMLLQRIETVRAHLRKFVQRRYGIELEETPVETPPRTELGDLAFTFPFELAKRLKKPPRRIAQEIADEIGPLPKVERVEAAGAGYVNLFFERSSFFRDLWDSLQRPFPPPRGGKIIVEHTNINPNKAAHIGHLRNAALGDCFVRLLRAAGHPVEVQNYIDNTGVQVADVVVGFQQLRGMTLEEVQSLPEPFDYYCWDLYAEVSDWFRGDETRLRWRHTALKEIEEGNNPTARLADYIANRIVRRHLQTMHRIGVEYDVLPRESEILHLKFWEEAFQLLKERQAIYFADEGPHQGCWVMHLPGENGQQDEEKIIVRSNGTVTYVGKDIAYQLWKFGLLNKNFYFQPFHTYPSGHVVWTSTAVPCGDGQPDFGGGERVYNVIDVRQSYLQRVVVQGLRGLGFEDQASRSIHFSYEMVALSPRCCQELGIPLSEEDLARPYLEVSGRKGLGVKADDLIDRLVEKARQEVDSRQPDLSEEARAEIARQIAVGALRYFLLRYTRNAVIAFDFNEALSFEGETGPYLQYSVVRADNIFRKLAEQNPDWTPRCREQIPERLRQHPDKVRQILEDGELWNLVRQTGRLEEVVRQSIEMLEVSCLAKYAFSLAQQFNLFYHRYHILSEPDPIRRDFYLSIADCVRLNLVRTLDLLGIEVPEKM